MKPDDYKRYVWRHNALNGSVRMAGTNMQSIIDAPSTTLAAKTSARAVREELERLQELMTIRIDPPEIVAERNSRNRRNIK